MGDKTWSFQGVNTKKEGYRILEYILCICMYCYKLRNTTGCNIAREEREGFSVWPLWLVVTKQSLCSSIVFICTFGMILRLESSINVALFLFVIVLYCLVKNSKATIHYSISIEYVLTNVSNWLAHDLAKP